MVASFQVPSVCCQQALAGCMEGEGFLEAIEGKITRRSFLPDTGVTKRQEAEQTLASVS